MQEANDPTELSPLAQTEKTIARFRETIRTVAPALAAAKKKKRLQKTFKRGQSVKVGGHEIVITKGKAHLSFPAGVPVEWEVKKARS